MPLVRICWVCERDTVVKGKTYCEGCSCVVERVLGDLDEALKEAALGK